MLTISRVQLDTDHVTCIRNVMNFRNSEIAPNMVIMEISKELYIHITVQD